MSEDEDEDVAPRIVHPCLKPCPIQKQQVPAPQTPFSAHGTSIQFPEDTVTGSLPQEYEIGVGEEITLVGTEESPVETYRCTVLDVGVEGPPCCYSKWKGSIWKY